MRKHNTPLSNQERRVRIKLWCALSHAIIEGRAVTLLPRTGEIHPTRAVQLALPLPLV